MFSLLAVTVALVCNATSLGVGEAAACSELAGKTDDTNWFQLMLQFFTDYSNGPSVRIFNGISSASKALASDPQNDLLADWMALYISGTGTDAEELQKSSDFGGADNYTDSISWENFGLDNLGMLTDGLLGTPTPDAFLGSYNEVDQVVAVDPVHHTITIAVAAYNKTGVSSLTHLLPDKPSYMGGLMNNIQQYYFWTEVVTVTANGETVQVN